MAGVHPTTPRGSYVWVRYKEGMLLRLPIKATNMASGQAASVSKLTLESIQELVALARQDEQSWIFEQKQSGKGCTQTNKQKSSRQSVG